MCHGVNKVLFLIVIHLFYSITLRASNISISPQHSSLTFQPQKEERKERKSEGIKTENTREEKKLFAAEICNNENIPHTSQIKEENKTNQKSIVMIMIMGKVCFLRISMFSHPNV